MITLTAWCQTIGARVVVMTTSHAASLTPSPSATPSAAPNLPPNGATPASGLHGASTGTVDPFPATAGTGSTPAPHGLGDFTWTQVVTLLGALIAAGGVILTLLVNASRSRRDNLTTLYANALGAVAEYLEGPYRILRKDGEKATRFAITSKLSDVKTSIDHNQALLRLHADDGVADAYDAYVRAAKEEAGKQMHEAWKVPPVTTDEGVNLNVSLPRGDAEAARARLVEVMQADLHRRWWSRTSKDRYRGAVRAVRSISVPATTAPRSASLTPGNPSQ